MEYFVIVVLAIALLVIYQMTKENFMETSYYYEAAPGARGARMICMPENGGTASLGIAVGRAAGDAAARIARRNLNTCGPIVDHSTIDTVTWKTRQQASKAATQVIAGYIPSSSPGCPEGMIWDGKKCRYPSSMIKTSPGCPNGMIWDGKKCRYPRGKAPMGSPGCPSGMVWDGKKCRKPSSKTSPGCPYGMIWDGKKCRLPSSAASKTSPGCPPGTVWDGKKCRKPSSKVKTSAGCPSGMVWDGKKCKVPSSKVKTSAGCPKGMVWDGKKCKKPSSKVKTSAGCPKGMVWDGKKCKKPSASKCKKGSSWDKKTKKCKPSTAAQSGKKWKKADKKKVKNAPAALKAAMNDPSRKTGKKTKCSSDKFWDGKSKKCLSKALKCKPRIEFWNGKKCAKVDCPPKTILNKKTGKCVTK